MSYQVKATHRFWKSLDRLSDRQKESARQAWEIFERNPFDPRLRPHELHCLSAEYSMTNYSASVEGDLRVAFFVEGDTVWSVVSV